MTCEDCYPGDVFVIEAGLEFFGISDCLLGGGMLELGEWRRHRAGRAK